MSQPRIAEKLKARLQESCNKTDGENIMLREILLGQVETRRLDFNVGAIREILRDQFDMNAPNSLWTLFDLNNEKEKVQLIEVTDPEKQGNLKDFVFLVPPNTSKGNLGIDDAIKTIHIHTWGKGITVRIGGVITCKDNIKRVAGVEYIRTFDEKGWVINHLDLSTNGIVKDIQKKEINHHLGEFPTNLSDPLLTYYTDALITKAMLNKIGKPEGSNRFLRFSLGQTPSFDEPKLHLQGDDSYIHPPIFPIKPSDAFNFEIKFRKDPNRIETPLIILPSKIASIKN